MTILVTGASGAIGSQVVDQLKRLTAAPLRALTRSPGAKPKREGVTEVAGDLLDIDALRTAMDGVDALFLLSAVIPEELTASLLALSVARECGVKGAVYLSVYNAEESVEVPHFAAKHAAERMIERFDMPVTVLRPTYFAQNDAGFRDVLVETGIYPAPIGDIGVSVVDTRDIAEVAALELVRRAEASGPLPRENFDLVGPDALTGKDVAQIWSELLDRPVTYGGNDLDPLEQQMREFGPGWMAHDMRQMLARFQQDGAKATDDGLRRLTERLGRSPLSYRDLAEELVREWDM